MKLRYYITFEELKKGGDECEITYQRPTKQKYVKVLSDSSAFCGRGENAIAYKDEVLAYEFQHGKFGLCDLYLESASVGIINVAKKKLEERGILK